MENIRKARPEDLSRIAEILVFVKRIKYRSIFHNHDYSFNELQVVKLAEKYGAPEIIGNIYVYDDGQIYNQLKINQAIGINGHIESKWGQKIIVDVLSFIKEPANS